jgi:hypothetical protein
VAEESSLSGVDSKAVDLKQALGDRSLEDHVRHLLKQEDEAVRMMGFLRLLEALKDPADIKAALDVITGDPKNRFRQTELAMLLQRWSQIDPKAAAAYANELRDFSRFAGMNAVLRLWVKNDPDAAIAWAEGNGNTDNGRGRDDGNWAVATLIGSLARTNLERAMQVANDQPLSRARGRMMDTLIEELIAQRGDESARDAIAALPDDPFRAGMADKVVERMARSNPQEAMVWASSLPSGETKQRAIAAGIGRWADKDPVAAGNYLARLGDAPEWDVARQRYAREVLRRDPEGAMVWAQAIASEELRADTIRDLMRDWSRRDYPAAQTWAAANGVQME